MTRATFKSIRQHLRKRSNVNVLRMAVSKHRIHSSVSENLVVFKACEQGDLKTLENALNSLSSNEISSIRDEQKATLVHHAARYGHLHILQYLIERKHLDISQLRTEHGATCAHDAAVCDQMEVLNYIFHYHQLTQHNQPDSFQKLRWTVRDGEGNSPLHLAAAYGSIRCLHYLVEYESADPHIRSYSGYQPIHYAASWGRVECVKLLLNMAPDTVNEQTNTLLTPLYLACQHGSFETIKILSSRGANFKLRDENGLNCLHAACQSAHLHVVQWLVEKQNANLDDVDYMNNTPLHFAAASGNEMILIYLLDKRAKILTSTSGNTPLHVAAENGQQGACAVLIERGHCSVTLRNNEKLIPADLADRSGFPSLANELRLRMNSPSSASSTNNKSIQLHNATVVRLVVKKRNVQRSDATSQVEENDLQSNPNASSLKKLTNPRFDLSELRAEVKKHQVTRRDTVGTSDQDSNVLMHSMESLNELTDRQRKKLPSQTYAPWLKMGNMSSEVFQEQILKVGSNLRKVRRDSLLRTDNENSTSNERRSRQSQSVGPPIRNMTVNGDTSSLNSETDYANQTENHVWKPTGFQRRPNPIPVSKSHQFITSSQTNGTSGKPDWQRALIDRRRAAANEMK